MVSQIVGMERVKRASFESMLPLHKIGSDAGVSSGLFFLPPQRISLLPLAPPSVRRFLALIRTT